MSRAWRDFNDLLEQDLQLEYKPGVIMNTLKVEVRNAPLPDIPQEDVRKYANAMINPPRASQYAGAQNAYRPAAPIATPAEKPIDPEATRRALSLMPHALWSTILLVCVFLVTTGTLVWRFFGPEPTAIQWIDRIPPTCVPVVQQSIDSCLNKGYSPFSCDGVEDKYKEPMPDPKTCTSEQNKLACADALAQWERLGREKCQPAQTTGVSP